MRLVQLYLSATRLLQSLLPAEEREFVKAVEQIGTDRMLDEIAQERLRRISEEQK